MHSTVVSSRSHGRHWIALAMAVAAALVAPAALADPVTCGGSAGQLRITTVDPGQVGGLCWTSVGNFNPATAESVVSAYTGETAVHLDKDAAAIESDPLETWLTGFARGTSGNWTISQSAWDTYDKLFLGFHFGNNNGAGDSANPDSFIIEVAAGALSGTWSLGGTGAVLNNLSHIDLIGSGTGGGGDDDFDVPEPTSLALVGLALVSAGVAQRRRRQRG